MANKVRETRVSDIPLPDLQSGQALDGVLSGLIGTNVSIETPLIAPAMLLGNPKIAANTLAMTPPEPLGVIHEFQLFRRTKGAVFPDVSDVVIREEVKPAGVVFDFEVSAQDDVIAQMQTRLRFVTAREMQALKGVAFASKFETPQTVWVETTPIGAGGVKAYLSLSYDTNPIHVDDAAAQAVGLAGAVLPGMLLCGLAEYGVQSIYPDARISEMKTRFMAAVPVGQVIRYAIVPRRQNDEGRLETARLFAVTQDEMIAAIFDVSCD
ncbi:MaoC family dehydratase [Shimia sp.]|uniref:MaoC family dehydratase n=1 Tax=Shimia sp. TaxID=1954381 RepID=UPI003298F947